MDDKYDLRGLLFSTFEDLIPKVLEGTPLEDSSAQIAFGLATFAVVNIVFLYQQPDFTWLRMYLLTVSVNIFFTNVRTCSQSRVL